MAIFFDCSPGMDRYVVIGNPVAHSLSPIIHAMFAAQAGDSLTYDRLLVERGEFMRAARAFFGEGGCGASITLPFKVDAFDFADARSDRATRAGAANFLMRRGDTIFADNTDGAGLVADLTRNLGVALHGKQVLLVGAGGAARGVLGPLLDAQVARVVIANRTVERARALAELFAASGRVEGCALDAIAPAAFDVTLNATSASTHGESLRLPDAVFGPSTLAYDLAYGPAARAFIQHARALGALASDGLGMLVEQAAEAFALWRGKRPSTALVLAQLRAGQE